MVDGGMAQETTLLVHNLIQDDEQQTTDQTASGEGVKGILVQCLADEIECQGGEQSATPKGHQRRDDTRPRRPDERDEGPER